MAIHNDELRKLRAMIIIQHKVNGHTNMQIANKMNLSIDTIQKELIWAGKADLFVSFEQRLINELVPKALDAIQTAMDDGDAETALEVLKCMGVLKDPKAPKTQVEQQESDELSKAIAEARTERAKLEGTVDGEVINKRSSLAGLLETSLIEPPTEATTHEASDSGTREESPAKS